MAIYFFFDSYLGPDEERVAVTLLEEQGYTEHPTCKGSYLHTEKSIISLGFDQRIIQVNFNDNDLGTGLRDFQRTVERLREICDISSYQTDMGGTIPKGVNLEGLIRRKK